MKDTGLIDYWKRCGIKINEGASEQEIMILEKYLNFTFPRSFKELYLEMNGFKDLDWDAGMFSMMPLERIKEEYNSNNKDFIPFCDYLINCHQIGFSKMEKGIFVDYGGGEKYHDHKAADTFIECLIEILKDSEKVN